MTNSLEVNIVFSCLLCLLGASYLVNAFDINIPEELKLKNCDDPDEKQIELSIEDGKILGLRKRTVGTRRKYYVFRGIPFAKPPTGSLRFKPPERNLKWDGTLDATQEGSECVQSVAAVTGSEDCLYINVYTPSLRKKNLPVMVWIYGGAFLFGNSSYDMYGPDYLLEEGVIFVSFNYRLGVFGFISTEDLTCPGNFGIKDQILALKWVQSNIRHFGGDPGKVTVFGESAGAASIAYILQVKETKGLYRSVIMESGSSLCLWALNRRAGETAVGIATALGVSTSNSSELIDGLRKIDYKTLQDVATTVSTAVTLKNPLAGIMFGPVKEPYHAGAVFYSNSEDLLSQGYFQHVPIIAGFNSNEGAAAQGIPAIISPYLLKYDVMDSKLTPADLTNDKTKIDAAANRIRQRYFGVLPLAAQRNSVVKFISDDQFNRPIRRMNQDMSKYARVYFYKFSFDGVLGGRFDRTVAGPGHIEELGYIFTSPLEFAAQADGSINIRNRLVRMWTNFAKHSDPTPYEDSLLQNVIWQPVADSVPNYLTYLNINSDMNLRTNPFADEMAFWDQIYQDYGDPPFDTY